MFPDLMYVMQIYILMENVNLYLFEAVYNL